ncbi:PBECR4 domain-containing protein [Lactobacillus sp. ESL0677]|uniref:PBECR4 domain-containing protein n=1 Tax=Lactobacillus sp. ESL0677 TaxID=2983208 RepID=UPI0023F92186|nr:PBECR4 domain-containing protein [Lactobacillus sp. ESL0677]WEV37028.1 PBECR4 domain-containing protein [Lactobacillus sp. ESL0677]
MALDLLRKVAVEYNKLIGKEIEFTLGHKNRKSVVTVMFTPSDFHHLAGLHKLTDIQAVYKQSAEIVFNKIVAGEICLGDINRSVYFAKIEERLEILSQINDIFTRGNLVFKYICMEIKSKITWKYLLKFKMNEKDTGYLFLDECRREPNKYICVTDFKKEKFCYERGQMKLKLLQTKLINGEDEQVIYLSNSYIKK